MAKNIGTIFLIFGASGSGKTTLCKKMCNKIQTLERPIYFTTRLRRSTEKEGSDYYFVTQNEFNQLQEQGKFKYVYSCHGNNYGIPSEIDKLINRGRSVILGVSRKLYNQICLDYSKVCCIYIDVAEKEACDRMRLRDSNITQEELENRLKKLNAIQKWAFEELKGFDLVIDKNVPLEVATTLLENYVKRVVCDEQ